MATTRITRHFATIEGGRWGTRQVHYRRTGKGPVLVLLHQSPLSSRDMIATMQRWQRHYTCIAPDTPGYGLSDPLGVTHAEMEDFATAAIEFLDAIGVAKAAFYGFHTGAMLAAAVAARYPQRVHTVVANGYVIPTTEERAELVADYLPPFVPQWDGTHLAWLWGRMREQVIFFPWYRKAAADRMFLDLPPPQALQSGLVDFLRAGDHYRVAYRAAFTMPANEALQRIEVPALVTASRTDPTSRYLARVSGPAPAVTVRECATPAETLDLSLAHLRRTRSSAAPKPAATRPIAGRLWKQMLDVPGGQLRIQRNDDGAGRPVVVVHDAVGSSDTVAPLAAAFIGRRPVVAIDLPGHGESDDLLPRGAVTVTAQAKALRTALAALGIRACDIVGVRGGGLVGLELARLAPKCVRRLVLAGPMYFDKTLQRALRARYAPDIQVDGHGGHLLQAWQFIRDQGHYWPWYEQTRDAILRTADALDPAFVHQRVLEIFRAPGAWRRAYRAHFTYPVKSRLRAVRVPVLLAAAEGDPMHPYALAAAKAFPHLPVCTLARDPAQWARDLLPFLDA
ncbi:MAG: alpha/beta fold hydrolase [Steroidobacteraceae bacterium]